MVVERNKYKKGRKKNKKIGALEIYHHFPFLFFVGFFKIIQ